MWKKLIPSACALALFACNEDLPTNADSKSDAAGVAEVKPSGSIEIENSDLTVLKKNHALAKASGLRIKDPEAQEILAKYLAKALAKSLSQPGIREILKEEVGMKFDGDFNVLWSRIKSSPLSKGTLAARIRGEFSAGAQASGIMEMFEEFRRLQIAIPKNFDKWDGTQPLLVAWVPFRKDDLNTDFIYAYDANQQEFKLDGKLSPELPVIVISRNERTNNNEELLGGIFVDAGSGKGLVQMDPQSGDVTYSNESGSSIVDETKFGYPEKKEVNGSALPKKAMSFAQTPRVPLNWDRVIVSTDLEGWFMGGMEVRMHLLSDKEVALTAEKNGVYEDNNYTVGTFLRNINEDISRYIGVKLTEIDDNDWDKNFTFKLSADVAKQFKGKDANGNAMGEIAYNFGGDTDDDEIGENNKIELGSQDVPTYWTAGSGRVKFNYNPGVVEYDISAMPYVSATGNGGRGNEWNIYNSAGADWPDEHDVAYRLIVPANETNTYKISTCDSYTNFDTQIQIFDKDQGTPYWSDDDYSCQYGIRHSTLTAQLSAGTYYIVVDGYAGYWGSFRLTVQKL